MVAPAKFWDKSAAKYAKSPIKDMASYEATLERVRAHLSREMEVLEIGCGTGTTALKLRGAVKFFTATDISGEMIAIAKEKAGAEGAENADFLTAAMDDHPFAPEQFDAVMAFNLLHLIEDVDGALAAIHGLIKPGGLFISKTVCLGELTPLFRLLLPVMQLFGRAPYVAFYKTEELDNKITSAGFEMVETGYYSEKSRSRFVVARKR
ncbi:class I SAM-dependent methyltransferase [Hyphococcus flavus]|uniref:Class I SAM-dependent methyltransferase n=1 Tax=Hyphococcus flavus TaxID=1866326 RepID=A0AAF0CFL8_9PROT|nr:class I SAM-dependent methyltransferase [Hyphococcus flavus]WDI31108.1 class I SAM-dependent methyltransferase [Hyphococcus flavus]